MQVDSKSSGCPTRYKKQELIMSTIGAITLSRDPIALERTVTGLPLDTYQRWGNKITQLPLDMLGALSVFLANEELEGLGRLLRDKKMLDQEQVKAVFSERMRQGRPLSPRLYTVLIKHLPEREKLKKVFDQQLTRKSTYKRPVTPEDVQKLGRFINLRRLSYAESLSDDGLAHLSKLPSLHELKILLCKKVTDAGLVHLKGLFLTSLILSFCSEITDQGLAHLSDLPLLQSLELRGSVGITNAGLAHLSGLPLQSLDLSFCLGLTSEGLPHLNRLPLRSLKLSACPWLTDDGLAHLSRLPLQSLDLSLCVQLTDAGLAHLSQLPITKLNLFGCSNITPAAIARLLKIYTTQGNGRVKTPKGSYSKLSVEITT